MPDAAWGTFTNVSSVTLQGHSPLGDEEMETQRGELDFSRSQSWYMPDQDLKGL